MGKQIWTNNTLEKPNFLWDGKLSGKDNFDIACEPLLFAILDNFEISRKKPI